MEKYEVKRIIKQKAKGLFKILQKINKALNPLFMRPVTKREYKILTENLKNIDNEKEKILYVGIPLHTNLGDQAQYYCITKWINENYPNREIIELPDCLINSNFKGIMTKKIKPIIDENDIIVCQSGYRTADFANYQGENAHRKIIEYFSNNQILVLPQTVNFVNPNEAKLSSEAYSKGKKVMFLARDNKSYEMAKKLYKNNTVDLYPDIVTTLIGQYQYQNNRNGILCCLRRDGEKYYENSQLEEMIKKLSDIGNVSRNDTTINIEYEELKNNLKNILEETFEDFSKYKLIITDRYHGTIFGLISNTPTIVLSSADHKLSSGVDWFKNVKGFENYVFYANNLEEAVNIAKKIYNKEYQYNLPEYFKNEYYDKLKDKLNKI